MIPNIFRPLLTPTIPIYCTKKATFPPSMDTKCTRTPNRTRIKTPIITRILIILKSKTKLITVKTFKARICRVTAPTRIPCPICRSRSSSLILKTLNTNSNRTPKSYLTVKSIKCSIYSKTSLPTLRTLTLDLSTRKATNTAMVLSSGTMAIARSASGSKERLADWGG